VFGHGLWETSDGGQHWASAAYPGGSIMSLAAIDGQVLALTATCSVQAGCAQPGTLWRRPLAGGAWSQVTRVTASWAADPTDIIATQANVAAVLDGRDVVVTPDGGLTITRHVTPCAMAAMPLASSVAVIAPGGLALLCIGQGFTGHTVKTVYASGDLGATWVTPVRVAGEVPEHDHGPPGGRVQADQVPVGAAAAEVLDQAASPGSPRPYF
jgi:hypothetical protein